MEMNSIICSLSEQKTFKALILASNKLEKGKYIQVSHLAKTGV